MLPRLERVSASQRSSRASSPLSSILSGLFAMTSSSPPSRRSLQPIVRVCLKNGVTTFGTVSCCSGRVAFEGDGEGVGRASCSRSPIARLDISAAVDVTLLSRAEAGKDDTDRPQRDRDIE